MTDTPTVIRVSLERYPQGFVATSKTLKGLFVAHTSLADVYDAVPVAIKLLFKAKDGVDVVVTRANEPSVEPQAFDNILYVANVAQAA